VAGDPATAAETAVEIKIVTANATRKWLDMKRTPSFEVKIAGFLCSRFK